MWKAVGVLCLSILAQSIPLAASAQAVYGSIVGTVVDSSGAGVPNAKVTITDLNRSVSFATDTNESGFFTQRSLIAGRYQVRIEATGFSTYLQEVRVSVDQETTVDVKLQVGQLSETVEVTGGAPGHQKLDGLVRCGRRGLAPQHQIRRLRPGECVWAARLTVGVRNLAPCVIRTLDRLAGRRAGETQLDHGLVAGHFAPFGVGVNTIALSNASASIGIRLRTICSAWVRGSPLNSK
jgi:hypothetical protein